MVWTIELVLFPLDHDDPQLLLASAAAGCRGAVEEVCYAIVSRLKLEHVAIGGEELAMEALRIPMRSVQSGNMGMDRKIMPRFFA